MDKLNYVKEYIKCLQPFMISEFQLQESFENAICVLDNVYRISLYIKVNSAKNEEIVVSFHENHKRGIAKKNSVIVRENFVYVFADTISSHVDGTDNYSINFMVMRGVGKFPINVAARKYDDEGFLVRYSDINNAILGICNQYIEDLYTSDLQIDFSEVQIFTALQQLSFTSYGRDIVSNISLLIDSLLIQKDVMSKKIADSAICIYCSSLKMLEYDRRQLIDTLNE